MLRSTFKHLGTFICFSQKFAHSDLNFDHARIIHYNFHRQRKSSLKTKNINNIGTGLKN